MDWEGTRYRLLLQSQMRAFRGATRPLKFVPHQYQRAAIDFLIERPHAALFADPGLGKTGILLSLLRELYFIEPVCPALVIAPKRVATSVWSTEIDKFAESFGFFRYEILHGKNKEDTLNADADIYLLNVENIFWALGKREWNTLIIDESSRFKTPGSKRFKALRKHLDNFKRRYILTGTPAPQGIMDLFAQQYLVDQGEALGRYVTHYRRHYFDATTYRQFTEWTPKPWAQAAVRERMAPTTMRLDAAEHLDLPEIIYHPVAVELPQSARRLYKQLETEFFAELGDSTVLVESSAELYNRCCQVANGRMYVDDRVEHVHKAKIEAVDELIGELQGKPVLIAYHYKHDLDQLLEHFGADTPCIRGDVDVTEIASKWNDGELPVLLGHPLSMGHGLNLQQGGRDIIWFGPPDNLESYIQFNGRIWRQGVTSQVRVHILVASNTVDEAKYARLGKKGEVQQRLLDALRQYGIDRRQI